MDLLAPFRGLFAARRTRERSDPETSRIPFNMGRTLAGVYVTPDRALTNAVVWACVRYLSTTVAQLPWRVMRRLPGGGAEVVERHPADAVLAWRTNPEMGPFQFKETLIAWALLWGNAYAEIVRDGAGRVVELWPIHPERVTVQRDTETDALLYEVRAVGSGERVLLRPMDVFHLRGFGNGPVGLSVVEHAAQSIGWAQATELFGAAYFGEGLHPAGFIEGAGALTPDGKKTLREQLKQMFGGPRRAHRVAFLDAGMKWNRVAVQPDESQFIETRQHQVEEICRWFGVPPHKVAHLLRSTFNNIEHQSIEVVVDAVSPWVIRLEEEGNFKLFGTNRQGLYTDMDMRALLRGDNKSRAEYLKVMREMGAFNVNEVREYEGENPIGPEGDKRIVQSQYTTLERIGEEPAAPPPPPPAAQPDNPDAPPVPDTDADMAAVQRAIAAALRIEAHAA